MVTITAVYTMRMHMLSLVLAIAASAQETPLVFDLNEAILENDVAAIDAMIQDGVKVNGRTLTGERH